ncbi:MAG: transcription termination/antitermination factor NusG [Ruminococcaceae bacterium]|nr:transcription termination/antitermination factor NusG [Oscillospiraceae bacterium]
MSDFENSSQEREALWYVIHTYAGYENKVATNLKTVVENRGIQDLIQDIRVPTESVKEYKTVKKREIGEDGIEREIEVEEEHITERKIFPGYVLVKMVLTDDTWYIVRNIRGCTGFVGPESKPIPLTEEEIHKLGVEQTKFELPYKVGDTVKVVEGHLEGYVAQVDRIELNTDDPKLSKVWITVNMFGRSTPADIDPRHIVPLD